MEKALQKTLRNGKFMNVDKVVSARMQRILSSETRPELRLRTIARRILPKYSKIIFYPDLPGKPDIFIPSLRIVLFCDGCFFHGCSKHGHLPGKNAKYWSKKFELNKERDKKINNKLRSLGYRVWRIWEHYLLNDKKAAKLEMILRKRILTI